MKKIYFTALSFMCALGVEAQTITAANHTPLNGDQFSTYQCDSTTVSIGGNGAGINWNFNSLVTHSSIVENYTTVAATFTAWPTASLSVSSNTANTSYYSATATDLQYWGGQVPFGGVPVELKFTNPAFFMAYPTALNQGTTSAVSGSCNALSQAGTFTGVCTVTVLATGTMVLPAKTFSDVIRVNQNMVISFTAGVPGTATRNQYEFYSLSDSRYPILTISQSTISSGLGTSSQTFVTVQKNYQTVGLNEAAPFTATELGVYPNPSSSVVNFVASNTKAATITLYDITGKMIETHNLNFGMLSLNVSSYSNGLYIYKLTDANNQPIKTGKLTVQH